MHQIIHSFTHDIGLDASLLSLIISTDHIYPLGGEDRFVSCRTKLAERVKSSVGKVEGGNKDLRMHVRKITEAPLKSKLLLLLQGLPTIKKTTRAESLNVDTHDTDNFMERTPAEAPLGCGRRRAGPRSTEQERGGKSVW